jgi:hypothetical protein
MNKEGRKTGKNRTGIVPACFLLLSCLPHWGFCFLFLGVLAPWREALLLVFIRAIRVIRGLL